MAKTASKLQNQDAFDRALGYFDEARRTHQPFITQVDARYKAYRGLLDNMSEAADWTSKQHPPYINHIVETTLSSLIDDKLRFRVRPRVTLDQMHDKTAAERARMGAEAHKILFDWQVRKSRFTRIQRPFMLQNAIAGVTVAKTYWETRQERRRHTVVEEHPLLDAQDNPMLHPMTGQQITMPHLVTQESMTTVYDGPVTEVRDIRDFLWHESAVSLDRARYVIDRVWMSKEEILEGFSGDDAPYGPDRGGWSRDDVEKALSDSGDQKDDTSQRDQGIFNTDRTKDLLEVIEVWDQIRHEVTTIVGRAALLSHRPFPFFHGRTPFVVCSTQPDLFRIPGISQVEKVVALQNLLWSLTNQRIDNLKLVNNAIFWFRPDVEDVDDYEFEPGARWPVEDPAQVQMWTPNVIPAEVSLGAEALIKGDLQNLAGGFPFSSGTDSQTVDQKTATGASIITGLAQRSINASKQQVYDAWEDVGQQRLVLNGQFIREPTAATVLGVDNEEILHEIMPEILTGDYELEIEPVPDAIMKQEDQASAQALIQLAGQLVPITIQLASAGAGRALNMDAFVEDLLKAFGKEDTERYFISKTPPAVDPNAAAQDPNAAQAQAGGDQPVGITGPQSIDPAVSPAAQISEAPSTLLHRAQALAKGGGQNVPK